MAKFHIVIFKELCVFVTVVRRKKMQPDRVFIVLWALSETEDSVVGFN